MKIFFLFFLVYFSPIGAEENSPSSPVQETKPFVVFTPPTGWKLAPKENLPSSMITMVVGKGSFSLPPTINLTTEPYKKSLKDYLKIVKNINSEQGYDWKDLGMIRTQSGNGHLSQVDTKSQWGEVREMRVILLKEKQIYILTALALKEEFSLFYKDFFTSFRSLRIVNDLYDILPPQERKKLKEQVAILENKWKQQLANNAEKKTNQQVFESKEFQEDIWTPFIAQCKEQYKELDKEWLSLFLDNLYREELIKTNDHPM